MKGAPEVIFDKCSTILSLGKVTLFDDKRKNQLNSVIEELGVIGEKVIGKLCVHCTECITNTFTRRLR